MNNSKETLLNLDELSRFDNLLVFAQAAVEGYFAGRHRSASYGSSAQFKDFRDYQAGDELNRVDWRGYAKSGRLTTRRYDSETDMVVYLIVDMSASMNFGESSKINLAARIAAALTYLMITQGDKVGLVLFDEKVTQFIPPGSTRKHLFNVVGKLERITPKAKTDLPAVLTECQGLFQKRGRIVILSDFWEGNEEFFESLSYFIHRRYEVLLMQIMDEGELNLPDFGEVHLIDMETQEGLRVDVAELRSTYKKKLQQFLDQVGQESEIRRIQHSLINTKSPYMEAIESYLGLRKTK